MHTRTLSSDEYLLAKWMLEHGQADAQKFLSQLEQAKATLWKCPCGCASFDFSISGKETSLSSSMRILGDFVFKYDGQLHGVFIFEKGGILAGVEFYAMEAEASKSVPSHEILRSLERSGDEKL